LAPPLLKLGHTLRKLGMNSAFDEPPRSANFERIAPRKPDDYLHISEVFHKTFRDLDEKGTEAAAATVVMMPPGSAARPRPKPVEVKVDRPFFFCHPAQLKRRMPVHRTSD
jgi:serine protease inhibitor